VTITFEIANDFDQCRPWPRSGRSRLTKIYRSIAAWCALGALVKAPHCKTARRVEDFVEHERCRDGLTWRSHVA